MTDGNAEAPLLITRSYDLNFSKEDNSSTLSPCFDRDSG